MLKMCSWSLRIDLCWWRSTMYSMPPSATQASKPCTAHVSTPPSHNIRSCPHLYAQPRTGHICPHSRHSRHSLPVPKLVVHTGKLNNAKHAVNHIEQGAPDLVASSVPGQTWLISLTYNNLTYARSESLCTGGIPIPSPKRAQHPSTVGKNGASCQLGNMAASLRVQTMPYCQGRCYGACGLLQSTPSTYNSKQLSHRVIGRSVAHNEVSS